MIGEILAEVSAGVFVARALTVALRSNARLDTVEPQNELPFLSIIVPARNEQRQIETCVRSLLAQRYPMFEVVVIDDCSSDGTAAIVERLALQDHRLRLIHGEALPAGWVGKPWALAQGARHARGSWLLFTDADTKHEPLACASAVQYALRQGVRFLSLLPAQRFQTTPERVFLPAILWMIAFGIGSLDAINDPNRLDAAIFNGQYLLCARSAFEAIGGHDRVRDSIAEDFDLARLVKADGRFRSMLVGANDLVSTRMYRSFTEIWNGFSKNLYIGLKGDPLGAVLALLLLGSISPLPEVVLARAMQKRRYAQAFRMLAAIGATMAASAFGMRRFGFPRASGLYFPIGAATMLAIFLNSAFAHRTGRVKWRGRSYRG